MSIDGGYLDSRFRDDQFELERTKDLIHDVKSTFARFVLDADKKAQFSYEAQDGKEVEQTFEYSQSTNAMILFALVATAGKAAATCPLLPGGAREPFPFEDKEIDAFRAVWQALVEVTNKNTTDYNWPIKGTNGTTFHVSFSGTFGIDDPFTLTWLFELTRTHLFGEATGGLQDKIKKRALLRAKEVFNINPSNFLTWDTDADTPQAVRKKLTKDNKTRERGYTSLEHAFPALRFLQLYQGVTDGESFPPSATHLMEALFDRQLSRADMPNDECDVSELVFSLEALLMLGSSAITHPVIERVFKVIAQKQRESAHWRPVKPFVSRPQGHVLFPLSVEMASSLLRCCALLEEKREDPYSFTRNLDLFKHYADWLHARRKVGRAKKAGDLVEFVGWHSEHVHLHQGIHLWETSQVLLFLSHYWLMLDRHVARSSREAAKMTFTKPPREKDDKDLSPIEYWNKIGKSHEPLSGLPPESWLRLYDRVGQHLIKPRSAPNTGHAITPTAMGAYWSLLLYGPPGAGKTEFAEELCKALGWPLITITPSDFIRGGESQVEERAKMIFDVLRAQSEVVVLFDEIDRMLLDRDSERYGNQSDIFQFMTPGMLTKLRALRREERVVFLIATNYAERIDAAAKRRGRVDAQFLVAPPDAEARGNILKELTKGWISGLSAETSPSLEQVAKKTPLMVFTELQQLVNDTELGSEGVDAVTKAKNLEESVPNAPPAISLLSYEGRFGRLNANEKFIRATAGKLPFDEFLLLLYLRVESGDKSLNQAEKILVKGVFEALRRESGAEEVVAAAATTAKEIEDLVRKKLKDEKVVQRLGQHYESQVQPAA